MTREVWRMEHQTVACKGCGKDFEVIGSRMKRYSARKEQTAKFCDKACYDNYRRIEAPRKICPTCGKEFMLKKFARGNYNHGQKTCSRSCGHKGKKFGGFLDKHGYRIITVDGKQTPEHRDVMEKKIGRALFAEETVHHINGQRADNRIENLELWSSRHGKGQRVEDKIEFCRTFLQDYGAIAKVDMSVLAPILYG